MIGFIYKIHNKKLSYYGSTSKDINARLKKHVYNYKYHKQGKYNYVSSFDIIKTGEYQVSLVETVEYKNKDQLEKREAYFINNFDCVNKIVPRMKHSAEFYKKKRAYNLKYTAWKRVTRELNRININ